MDMQTSLRMSKELRDRLARAAEVNGRPIGEEMRRRLEASFALSPKDTVDSETAKLAHRVTELAALAGVVSGRPWHENAFANVLLRAALPLLVPQVSGDLKPQPGSPAHTSMVQSRGSDDGTPEQYAPVLAGIILASDLKEQKP
jgi:hypothetical protein